MGHVLKSFVGLAATAAVAFALSVSAQAGACKGRHCKSDRYGEDHGGYRHVTAYATTGGKAITAPVREGRWGDEVLVGANWIDCEITCEYTLRRLTVDFWDTIGQNKTVTPGYFRYDFDLETGAVHRRGPAIFGRY